MEKGNKKAPKGLWLRVILEDGTTYSRLGLHHWGDVQIWLEKYKSTPNVLQIDVMAQDHLVKSFKTTEEITMGALTAYREANPVNSSFRPNIDQKANPLYKQKAGPGKEFIVKAGLSFTLDDAMQADHGEYEYIDYLITFEDTPAFRNAQQFTDLEREYTLSLPSTEDRVRQLAVLREQYVGKSTGVKLAKIGKRFDIVDVE